VYSLEGVGCGFEFVLYALASHRARGGQGVGLISYIINK
jgi:hypothetical protein